MTSFTCCGMLISGGEHARGCPSHRRSSFDPGCTGKAQYASKADALRCLRGFNCRRSTKGGRGGVHPYRCDRCKQWHVGSNSFRAKELRR